MIDSKDVGATKKPWIVWGLLVGLLFLGISLIWIGQRDRDSGSRWQEKLDRELVSLYRSQLEHRLKWISLKGGTGHPDSGLFAKILHFDWGNYSAIGLEFSEKGAAEDDIRFVLAPSDFARPGFLVDGTGGVWKIIAANLVPILPQPARNMETVSGRMLTAFQVDMTGPSYCKHFKEHRSRWIQHGKIVPLGETFHLEK